MLKIGREVKIVSDTDIFYVGKIGIIVEYYSDSLHSPWPWLVQFPRMNASTIAYPYNRFFHEDELELTSFFKDRDYETI